MFVILFYYHWFYILPFVKLFKISGLWC